MFQILPQPSSGTTEYTIEIDGQQLRYRNTPPQWTNFVWPNPSGSPGATISATTFDGRTLQLVNEPGHYGLEKLINSAQRKRRPDGTFDLSWTQGSVTVAVSMRIISTSQASSGQQRCAATAEPARLAAAVLGGGCRARRRIRSMRRPRRAPGARARAAPATPAARPATAATAVSNTGGAQ